MVAKGAMIAPGGNVINQEIGIVLSRRFYESLVEPVQEMGWAPRCWVTIRRRRPIMTMVHACKSFCPRRAFEGALSPQNWTV